MFYFTELMHIISSYYNLGRYYSTDILPLKIYRRIIRPFDLKLDCISFRILSYNNPIFVYWNWYPHIIEYELRDFAGNFVKKYIRVLNGDFIYRITTRIVDVCYYDFEIDISEFCVYFNINFETKKTDKYLDIHSIRSNYGIDMHPKKLTNLRLFFKTTFQQKQFCDALYKSKYAGKFTPVFRLPV